MSREADRAILEGLYGLRVPAAEGLGIVAEVAAALAIGLALAALAGLALVLISGQVQRQPTRRQRVLAQLEAARGLPDDERLLAKAHLLRELTTTETADKGESWLTRATRQFGLPPKAAALLKDGLYRPTPATDASALEALDTALANAARRVKG
ncbi:MAG: hypothetical protein AAF415_18280 [Pseudomonadota bacterium]